MKPRRKKPAPTAPPITDFSSLRAAAQNIANRTLRDKNGNEATVAEVILYRMANHEKPVYGRQFLEIAFGKPEDRMDVSVGGGKAEQLSFEFRIVDSQNAPDN